MISSGWVPRGEKEPESVQLVRAWWKVAGQAVARSVYPVGVELSRLKVVAPSAAWLHEIERLEETLTRRLRQEPGLSRLAGISVALEIEPRPSPEGPPADRRSGTLEPPPPELLDAARSISDHELSRRWIAAAAKLIDASRRRVLPSR